MNEKYLPVGTIVTLKEATKRIMIIGYCPMDENKKMYDYNACLYPEGMLSVEKMLVFNHDQIKEINYMGLVDDEQKTFVNKIKEAIKAVETLKQVELPQNQVPQNSQDVNSTQKFDTQSMTQQTTPAQVNSIADIMNT